MQTKHFLNCRSGVSLLIGIGIVAVILFFSLLVSNVVVSSIRQSANVTNANRALYAAEGGLEVALLGAANNYPGYSTEGSLMINCSGGPSTNCTTIDYKIDGRIPAEQSYDGDFQGLYGLPAPGTGTAGSDCDPLTTFIKDDFYYSLTEDPRYSATDLTGYIGPEDPADHPCNWGKLRVGESVSVPLYTLLSPTNEGDCSEVIDDGVSKWCNPKGLGLDELKVRLRTPCPDGDEYCAAPLRYDLYVIDNADGHIVKDKTIVSWSVEGQNVGGDKSYYMGPIDFFGDNDLLRWPINSEIYASRINLAANGASPTFINLDINISGGQNLEKLNQDLIGHFLNDESSYLRLNDDRIHKPTLKLSVINSLLEHGSMVGDKVPYLEYQILLSNAVISPTGSSATITAEAKANEYKQTMEVNWPYDTNLLEYVIQQ